MSTRRADLDQIDRKILNRLQRDSRITNADLATEVGTSPASCLRRVRRLRETGYIEREIVLVNPDKVGSRLVTITEARLNSLDRKGRDEAIRLIKNIPEVIILYNVTGSRDLLFVSVFTDMADFERTIAEPLSIVPQIHSINSYFAIKTIKFEPHIHFDETR
ncbi:MULTISPECIES: Lrp/AsnC family transcriptional regulator [Mesorhizobium]|uniref:Lrp/AsnC family transcriptional regulator n=1 Tax=Mesorhizobium TaxID=68287 RepID=UPI0010A95315|nr:MULTISPECIES: Lrp/AsnC family transcriptional regulator [Mesorhizobium]